MMQDAGLVIPSPLETETNSSGKSPKSKPSEKEIKRIPSFVQYTISHILQDKDAQTFFFCVLGWFVSLYALYVEFKVHHASPSVNNDLYNSGYNYKNINSNSNLNTNSNNVNYNRPHHNYYESFTSSSSSSESNNENEFLFQYRAFCDINSYISCSSVLTSKYSRIFYALGIVNESSSLNQPNAKLGSLFYRILIFLVVLQRIIKYFQLVFASSSSSSFLSPGVIQSDTNDYDELDSTKNSEKKDIVNSSSKEEEQHIRGKKKQEFSEKIIQWIDQLILFLTIPSVLLTILLAYISLVEVKKLCLVCFASYIVNTSILYIRWSK